MILGFELKASCLLGRHSAFWSTPLLFFPLVIFETGSHIFAWAILNTSHLARITGIQHHAQLFLLRRGLTNFLACAVSNCDPSYRYLSSSWDYFSHMFICWNNIGLSFWVFKKSYCTINSFLGLNFSSWSCVGRDHMLGLCRTRPESVYLYPCWQWVFCCFLETWMEILWVFSPVAYIWLTP